MDEIHERHFVGLTDISMIVLKGHLLVEELLTSLLSQYCLFPDERQREPQRTEQEHGCNVVTSRVVGSRRNRLNSFCDSCVALTLPLHRKRESHNHRLRSEVLESLSVALDL